MVSGSVTFTPISSDPSKVETGKQASGTINSDGTFILSTYGRFDGAIVGKHSVQFSGAGDEDSQDETEGDEESDTEETAGNRKDKRQGKKQKPACVQKGEITLEVTAQGENDFTIELTPKST